MFGIDIEKKRKWVTTRKVGLLVFDISLIGDSLCTLLVLWVPTSSFFVSLFLILLIYYYYYTFSSSPHPNNNKQATKFSLAYKCFFLVREFLFRFTPSTVMMFFLLSSVVEESEEFVVVVVNIEK